MSAWTATVLVWTGAGRPAFADHKIASAPADGACYWCGHLIGASSWVARAVPVGWLPDSFPWHDLAAAPRSQLVCEACAWSMSQRAALPADYARARLERKAGEGRREQIAVGDETEAEIRLVLRLADGHIGLWSKGPNARSEETWTAAADELRSAPRDVGPCRYLGSHPLDALRPGTTRMQAFHHFGTASRWWPCTDTDRAELRAWLLDPPAEPWVGAIGDAKKHALPGAIVSSPRGEAQVVTYLGDVVVYEPDHLMRLIAAWEGLLVAGASDDEIASGRYDRGGLAWTLAYREHDPALAPHRGGPLLALVSYLRRNRKELTDGLPARHAATGEGGAPVVDVSPGASARPVDGAGVARPACLPPIGGQLRIPGLEGP